MKNYYKLIMMVILFALSTHAYSQAIEVKTRTIEIKEVDDGRPKFKLQLEVYKNQNKLRYYLNKRTQTIDKIQKLLTRMFNDDKDMVLYIVFDHNINVQEVKNCLLFVKDTGFKKIRIVFQSKTGKNIETLTSSINDLSKFIIGKK